MFLVAISIQNHDASLCIVKDGEVLILIQEERMSKIKHDSSVPYKMLDCILNYTNSIDYLCLANITEEGIDHILNFLSVKKIKVYNTIINNKDHHLFHASSAFYGSGFEESACLVIDGWGSSIEFPNNIFGRETTSIYNASYPNEFIPIYKNIFVPLTENDEDFDFESLEKKFNYDVDLNCAFDIGVMYGTITRHIGFSFNDQGKTMGISAYGKDDINTPNIICKNNLMANMNLFKANRKINTKNFPYLKNMDFEKKSNLAFSLQKKLEKIFLSRVDYVVKKTNCKNLVFSGGCALNILGNTTIKENFPKINLYIDPIASDACQSFGVAQFYYHKITNCNKIKKIKNLYLGPQYDAKEYGSIIKKCVQKYNKVSFS